MPDFATAKVLVVCTIAVFGMLGAVLCGVLAGMSQVRAKKDPFLIGLIAAHVGGFAFCILGRWALVWIEIALRQE